MMLQVRIEYYDKEIERLKTELKTAELVRRELLSIGDQADPKIVQQHHSEDALREKAIQCVSVCKGEENRRAIAETVKKLLHFDDKVILKHLVANGLYSSGSGAKNVTSIAAIRKIYEGK